MHLALLRTFRGAVECIDQGCATGATDPVAAGELHRADDRPHSQADDRPYSQADDRSSSQADDRPYSQADDCSSSQADDRSSSQADYTNDTSNHGSVWSGHEDIQPDTDTDFDPRGKSTITTSGRGCAKSTASLQMPPDPELTPQGVLGITALPWVAELQVKGTLQHDHTLDDVELPVGTHDPVVQGQLERGGCEFRGKWMPRPSTRFTWSAPREYS